MTSVDPHQQVLISTKAILQNHGRVLLVQNARSEWELPGGKLEKGESLNECLERELQEELRITLDSSKVVDVFKHHHYEDIIVIVYDCGTLTNPNYSLSDEHTDGGWFTLAQTARMNVPKPYQRVISQICGA